MKNRITGPAMVVEWSPTSVRVFEPASGRIHEADGIQGVAHLVSGKHVVLALSRRTSFVKSVRVPDVSKADAVQALRYQIGQHLPLEPGEASFDLALSGEASSEGRTAVLYAVRTETLREARHQIASVGGSVAEVTTSCLGAACLRGEIGRDEYEVVSRTPEGISVDVCAGGLTVYTRLVPDVPGVDLHDEIHRACGIVGRKPVYSVGAGGLDASGLGAVVATDALRALGEQNPDWINIEIPEEVAARTQKALSSKARLVVLMLAAAAAFGYLAYSDYEEALAEHDRLQAMAARQTRDDAARQKTLNTELTALKKKTAIVDQAFDPAQPFSDVLTVVSESAPSGLWLTGANLERGKPISFRGTALSDQAIKTFLDALAVSDRVRDVKLNFANNATIEETPVVNFSIQAVMVGNLPMVEKEKKKGSAGARVAARN